MRRPAPRPRGPHPPSPPLPLRGRGGSTSFFSPSPAERERGPGGEGRAGKVCALTLAAIFAALTASCIDVAAPPRDPLDVTISTGAALETTCTPTGPEVCFDARDNNCNGVIDEGCGLHTGILQFVIAWEAADADVDLNVTDPSGDVAKTTDTTQGGLTKDRDCPRDSACQGQNVENVYLAEGEPRKGHYKVVVHLEKLNGASAPVRVRLGVRMGPRSYGRTLSLSPGSGTEDAELSFDLH